MKDLKDKVAVVSAYDIYAPRFEGDERYEVRKIMAQTTTIQE